MALPRGIDAAEQAQEQERKSGGSRPARQWGYLSLQEGESIRLHPVHDGDEWYHAFLHVLTPTRPASPDWAEDRIKYWRDKRDAICPKRKPFDSEYCYICDDLHKVVKNKFTENWKGKSAGQWLADLTYFVPFVVREPVIATQEMIDSGEIEETIRMGGKDISVLGRVINHQVQMIEVPVLDDEGKETEETKLVPRMVLIKWRSKLFDKIKADFSVEGTILDRDYTIKRIKSAEGKTEYPITSTQVADFDLRVPELKADYEDIIPIEEIIEQMASEEYHAKYFNRDVAFPEEFDKGMRGEGKAEGGTDKSAPAAEPESAPEDDEKIKAQIAAMTAMLERKQKPSESAA
jgi:hypothetical protein